MMLVLLYIDQKVNLLENEIYLYEITNKYSTSIYVKEGSIWEKTDDEIDRNKYQWIGGTCLNDRLKLYLFDYLPHKIIFNDGAEYNLIDVIKINSKYITFNYFKENIVNLVENTLFNFEFSSNHTANIRVAVCKFPTESRFGFKIYENNYLSPVIEEIDNSEPQLRGYKLVNHIVAHTLPLHIFITTIESLSAKNTIGEALSFDRLKNVKALMIKTAPTNELKVIADKLLIEGAKLPINVIRQIESYL